MSRDLRDLRDLFAAAGAEERAAADPLDVAALLGRAHRRRAVRGTTYSAVGLGAAAAIVVGAVSADGLWRDDEPPAPPATETSEPTARPTRTPTAEPAEPATPTPDAFTPDWDRCGQSTWLDDWFLQEDSHIWLEPAEYGVAPADRPLSLDATVRSLDPLGGARVRLVSAFALEIGETGLATAVGVAAAPLDVEITGDLSLDSGPQVPPTDIPFTSCAASPANGGDGALNEALDPAGYYSIGVVAEVTRGDGTTMAMSLFAGAMGTEPDWGAAAPGPDTPADEWTIRDMRADGAQPVPLDSPVRIPTGWRGHSDPDVMPDVENLCGASATPWPPVWLSNMGAINTLKPPPPAGVANRFSVTATGFREGAELFVRVTTTNTGPAVNDAWIASPGVTIVKDGRIVGWRHLWNQAYAPATWGTGQTVQLELPLGQVMCSLTQNGEPWTAGTYEVYVQEAMDVLPQTGYATRWAYDADGGPFTFTLN